MTDPSGTRTFLFETTHHALWAEDVARESGVPAEVVPAPPEARAKCGLSLQCLGVDGPRLERALTDEGVEFMVFTPPPS